jgi:hypothetical protein
MKLEFFKNSGVSESVANVLNVTLKATVATVAGISLLAIASVGLKALGFSAVVLGSVKAIQVVTGLIGVSYIGLGLCGAALLTILERYFSNGIF